MQQPEISIHPLIGRLRCIAHGQPVVMVSGVSSLYGRVYRKTPFPPILIISFLPIQEGVSSEHWIPGLRRSFPPYTGGCIESIMSRRVKCAVSSLYGRVYRSKDYGDSRLLGFLPIREGVSEYERHIGREFGFPPYTGGCIGIPGLVGHSTLVSSLHGRVYRTLL